MTNYDYLKVDFKAVWILILMFDVRQFVCAFKSNEIDVKRKELQNLMEKMFLM